MDILRQETIVSVATPPGRGAIGMVRLSGPLAHEIVEKHFQTKIKQKKTPFFKLCRGTILSQGQIVDDVTVVYMPEGKSYTGDKMCEIFAHANPLILNRVVELCIKDGARLAAPGEFTYRAYMNGKMDLAQAQAVSDVILAKSEKSLLLAQQHLQGNFSREIEKMTEALLLILLPT